MIDFSRVNGDTFKIADMQNDFTREDLIDATHEMIDTLLSLVSDIPDSYVTFQPEDPHAYDRGAATEEEKYLAWTLAHVIVHITASGEETAALGATLARGTVPTWRDRYEVPWQTVRTTRQLVQRLEESRRIRLAYLNAWPDEPQLEVYYTKLEHRWGALNAVGYTLKGLQHDSDHLGQIEAIIQQAREAIPEPRF